MDFKQNDDKSFKINFFVYFTNYTAKLKLRKTSIAVSRVSISLHFDLFQNVPLRKLYKFLKASVSTKRNSASHLN